MHNRQRLGATIFVLAVGVWPILGHPYAINGHAPYIQSQEDFQLHVESHIRRVQEVGLALRHLFQEEFADVDAQVLRAFLGLHDQSKINRTSQFLRLHGLEGKELILSRLYQNYVRSHDSLPAIRENPQAREGLKNTIDELNRVDHEIALAFFAKLGLLDRAGQPNPIAQKLLLIEKVADLVDRAQDPVAAEEFNRTMLPAYQYLSDQRAKALAARLEIATGSDSVNLYTRIVKGLTFEEQKLMKPTDGCYGLFLKNLYAH